MNANKFPPAYRRMVDKSGEEYRLGAMGCAAGKALFPTRAVIESPPSEHECDTPAGQTN